MREQCLRDEVGREIRYLRLSVTAQCALHCVYCRPAEKVPDTFFLTLDEIENLVRHLVAQYGLRKVRLTGGEPT